MITQNEMETILDLLVPAYGEQAYPLNNPKKMAKISHLWSVMFQDDEPEEVLVAVKNCIATLQFPPKIADIKGRIAQNRMSGQMTEMEAWQKIREAVNKSSDKAEANKAFTNLSPILQKVVGSPSQLRAWYGVSVDTFEGAIASNIQRSYRELSRREATYYALPKDVQNVQSWMVEEPKEVTMLPEPAPQKSFEEMEEEADRQAQEYREKYLMPEMKDMKEKVDAFVAPFTDSELKMYEAREKRKAAIRMEKMKDRLKEGR